MLNTKQEMYKEKVNLEEEEEAELRMREIVYHFGLIYPPQFSLYTP